MDLVDRYSIRWHLPASASRRQGKSPPALVQAKRARRPFFSLFVSATSIVPTIEAVMMVVVMMMVTISARNHDDAGRIPAILAVMMVMMVMMILRKLDISIR